MRENLTIKAIERTWKMLYENDGIPDTALYLNRKGKTVECDLNDGKEVKKMLEEIIKQ